MCFLATTDALLRKPAAEEAWRLQGQGAGMEAALVGDRVTAGMHSAGVACSAICISYFAGDRPVHFDQAQSDYQFRNDNGKVCSVAHIEQTQASHSTANPRLLIGNLLSLSILPE
jgi:hypothetical protein